MRKSKVLDKIRAGRGVRICGLGHYLPFFVRYAAHNGYDAIWLDLEHRAMDQREIQGLLAMCHAHDIDCMVRAPTLERTRLYRYLEDGATGLMMPLVSDAGLAREIVEAVKYPPLGNRGLDGAGLDGDFGLDVWHEGSTYIDDANRETFIVLQIETPGALANVDEIAAVDGVVQPAPAPRFSRTPSAIQGPPPDPGAHTDQALVAWGFSTDEIAKLRRDGAIGRHE